MTDWLSILRLDRYLCARTKKSLATYAQKKKFPKKETPLQEYPVLLKDSPRTELVCSREYNLQKEILFVIKKTTAFLQNQTDQHKFAAPQELVV